jgi:hypothetical protein
VCGCINPPGTARSQWATILRRAKKTGRRGVIERGARRGAATESESESERCCWTARAAAPRQQRTSARTQTTVDVVTIQPHSYLNTGGHEVQNVLDVRQ